MEVLHTAKGTKNEKYEVLKSQLSALWSGESDPIANMGNMASAIKHTFDFHWVGFYLVRGQELVLGPFQGPIACTRIGFGKGVCGTAWKEKQTQLVPDVELFEGHIACSALTRSEIVIPVFKNGKVVAVLDVDSALVNDFDEIDQMHLEALSREISVFFLVQNFFFNSKFFPR